MTKDQRTDNAIATDYEAEHGLHPKGKLVHFSTVTHAWRGVLAEVTPSDFILAAGAVLVDSTGEIGGKTGYAAKRSGTEEGMPVAFEVRVPRGAVAWLIVLGDP